MECSKRRVQEKENEKEMSPDMDMVCEYCRKVTLIRTIIFTTKAIEVECFECGCAQVYGRARGE